MKGLLELLNTCYDYTIGTLWCISEEIWKERINDYDQESTRTMHYGLSARTTRLNSLEMIPMLHGTSSSSTDSVVVKGCSKNKGVDYSTYFGYKCAPISPLDFTRTPEEYDANFLESGDPKDWTRVQCIKINSHKSQITDNERRHLETFLKHRREWQ